MLSLPIGLMHLSNASLIVIVALYTFFLIKKKYCNSLTKKLIEVYILYLTCSFILIPIYGFPLSLIPKAIIAGIFPIFFGIIGCYYAQIDILNDKLLKYYYWGCLFMYICSIYLYLAAPQWYINRKLEMLPDEWKNTIQIVGLLSGFSSTGYLVGYTSLFAFTYLIFKIKKERFSSWKLVQLLIILFCSFFSQCRISLIWMGIVFIWYLSKELSIKKFFAICILIISLGYITGILIQNHEDLSLMKDIFLSKLENASDDSRYKTGFIVLEYQKNILIGSGYGTGGNYANNLGLPSVTDAEYFKLIYETGIIGFILFVLIILNTYLRIFQFQSKYKFEFFIVSFYLSAMLIANPLSSEALMAPIFWYCIGKTSLSTKNSKNSIRSISNNEVI